VARGDFELGTTITTFSDSRRTVQSSSVRNSRGAREACKVIKDVEFNESEMRLGHTVSVRCKIFRAHDSCHSTMIALSVLQALDGKVSIQFIFCISAAVLYLQVDSVHDGRHHQT